MTGCKYSLVIPVYNEEESLEVLIAEIFQVMTPLSGGYEIIFINDCSSDNSAKIIREFESQFPEVIRGIYLNKRSGQTFALAQGIQNANGENIITLDADLQNDPADIPSLLVKMEMGYDCVCGWRKEREDVLLKTVFSKLGNILQRVVTRLKIHDISCTLRGYKRGCLQNLSLEWEGQHRFIPLILSRQGYKIGEVVSGHRRRLYGRSKYSHRRIGRVILDFFRVLAKK